MFDPMQMGLMSLAGAQNPDMFAQLMAAQGISPSQIPAPMAQPNTVAPFQAGGLGAMMQPQAAPAGILPEPMSPAQAGMKDPAAAPGGGLMEALKGVKAPQQDKPVFSGGVSGSQGAPTVKVGAGMSGGTEAILRALLSGGGAASGIPSLGMLLKGV